MEITEWAKKIDWNKRVKAICKPCWEIKYCPYGSLVEYMPLKCENIQKKCRIFGHVCPVFMVAEPFTETKELRSISRVISREVQFKVIRRDNNTCQICSKTVLDKDIQFDHIIPWSKGGSSDESNIRILCPECNRKRGNDFESEYLVKDYSELVNGLLEITQEMLYDVILSILVINKLKMERKFVLTIENILLRLNLNKKQIETAEIVYKLAFELDEIISNFDKNNVYFKNIEIEKIKYRFGYNKNLEVHTIADVSAKFNVSITNILNTENKLFNFIGLSIDYLETDYLLEFDNLMILKVKEFEV